MKRLSLEELKAQSAQNVSSNLEAVKGGLMDDCHGLLSKAAEGLRIYFDYLSSGAYGPFTAPVQGF